ncbi:MAG: hypothetical protein AAFZ15_34710, partial [Bacteroidota bacterium]
MKTKTLFLSALCLFFFQIINSQNITGLYRTGKIPGGAGYQRASIYLKNDSTFQFRCLNDQYDYSTSYTAYGTYIIKKDQLKLILAEELKPKVKVDTAQGKYITFYSPYVSGLYVHLFSPEGKSISSFIPNERGTKYPYLPPYCSARIFCRRYDIESLIIDRPSNVYISNLQSDIAYYMETYSF